MKVLNQRNIWLNYLKLKLKNKNVEHSLARKIQRGNFSKFVGIIKCENLHKLKNEKMWNLSNLGIINLTGIFT
jgi:hypothetical protein